MSSISAFKPDHKIGRPLKILIPLIKDELQAGDDAGLAHYRRAGRMLIEAKEQIGFGAWGRWLTKNFELSSRQASRYMWLARTVEDTDTTSVARDRSLTDAIGEKRSKTKWRPLFEAAGRVNVPRLADERQARDREVELHRELAMQLIDLGYRAMATRLHPDRGGSRDAMTRLNVVRDELKSIAATRRFV
jgi:hypothetical protein